MNNQNLDMSKVVPSTLSPLSALSFYSPLIIVIGIFMFSIFSSAINKGLFYIICAFLVTSLRSVCLMVAKVPQYNQGSSLCNEGIFLPYTGLSYSTFMLAFTALYFITPMFIISAQNKTNTINYYVIFFFVAYIVFDMFIKLSFSCIKLNLNILADFLSGGLLGAAISLVMFAANKISIMFINELNSNKEVCSVPSKQQFKCSLYRNGTIVGSSVTA